MISGFQLCACPIGSPARGCDPMPFILWHDLIVNGCPNVTINTRDPAQKVHRWFRRLCACPIGSPARGCDPMPFILWHDLIVNGCPNVTINTRDPAQKVHRWFRRVCILKDHIFIVHFFKKVSSS
ncbi:unnamed protein product [Toxocara canis]|uniref:CxC1 domain-containing protein n=1 Tax=Toxocara canis TaxID=6265 RepID=A0A183VH12_TOXCA|nr:unnamed protein product [Toxocara canis]